MRSDHSAHWTTDRETIPGKTATGAVFRHREPKKSDVSNQQLYSSRFHYRPTLQISVAGGAILQMDQAASTHQGVLRDFRECRKDSSLDCRLRLRVGSHPQKAAEFGIESLRNSTNFECDAIRERLNLTSTYRFRLQSSGTRSQ